MSVVGRRTGLLAALCTTAVLVLSGLVVAQPAAAASRNGTCDNGEFCYYFNSDEKGSVSDFTDSLDDYGASQPSCYEFKGDGNGQGKCVKNNAASVRNKTGKTVRVYFNSNFAGTYQDFKAGASGNLNASLKNNNASHELRSSTPSTGCKTDGSNTTKPSSILVYRVALKKVERVDFRTYVENVLPNEWITSWPKASLQAGAVAVKSYGWYWALHSTRKTASGACFDVYDNTSSQVYKPGSAVKATTDAVTATWGARLARSGNVLQAHYCATSTACGAWVDGDWLSQYGSRDQANAGKSYAAILRYYYDGVTLS